MQLHGQVELILRDADTGEIAQRITQPNLIPDATYLQFASSSFGSGVFEACRISLSTQTTAPIRTNAVVNNIIATGAVPIGINSPLWVDTFTPQYGQIHNRFEPIGVDRTFRTVALTTLNANNNQANLTIQARAYLLLAAPCTQQANQVLDVFYRVQFVNPNGQGLSHLGLIQLGQASVRCTLSNTVDNGSYPYRLDYGYSSFAQAPDASYTHVYNAASTLVVYYFTGDPTLNWTTTQTVASHFKCAMRRDWSTSDWVGRIFQTMLQGNSRRDLYTAYTCQSPVGWLDTVFQTPFNHSAVSVLPFHDSLNLAQGSGGFNLSGLWSESWPQLIKLTIVTGGELGVATYRWSVRRHLGFSGNTYTNRVEPNLYRNPYYPAAPGMHGYREGDQHLLRFSDSQIVQYDVTGVTLLNVVNGAYQNWDTTTTPALPVTNIGQVSVIPGSKILVACRTSGLYELNLNNNTVTQLSPTPCYGVDVGRNNRVYAVFEGRLSNSDAYNTALGFASVGVSDNNWSSVRYLKCDPTHADDRVAIVNTTRLTWWSQTTGTATNGIGMSGRQVPNCLGCSQTGFWVAIQNSTTSYPLKLTYGSAATLAVNNSATVYYAYSVQFHETGFLILPYDGQLIRPDLTVAYDGTGYYGTTFVYMGQGIGCFGSYLYCLFDNSDTYLWQHYGWTGTQWAVGNPNAKATHAAVEALGFGVSVNLVAGDEAPSFIAGEYYTQGICRGMWKDNATTASYSFSFYAKPAILNAPIPNGTPVGENYTLPAAPAGSNPDPDWITAEVHEPMAHNFYLNGQRVIEVYTNGQPPGPNEVALTANGVLSFNGADAGKLLTGTYTYIRN